MLPVQELVITRRGVDVGGTDAGFARVLCLPIGASSVEERSRRPLRTRS